MSANIQYPLLLKPVIKDYLWGARALKPSSVLKPSSKSVTVGGIWHLIPINL